MKEKTLVLGLGISGKAVAGYLLSLQTQVIAADKRAEEIILQKDVQELVSKGLELFDESVSLEGVSQMILSPGIPLTHPLVKKALANKIEVIGEAQFGLSRINNRCIGVTGSNGKTTTVLWIAHVLNSVGIKARVLGNIGVGLSSYLLESDPQEILVIELSSFQLETLTARCLDYAVILNITENHLDRYNSMEEYVQAKLSIRDRLKEGGKFFQTPQAAEMICKEFNINKEAFDFASKSFKKPMHRIEWVAEIDGVAYYNDSKSTNIASTLYAVESVQGPIVLIVGGTDKGSSYTPWIVGFQGKVVQVIAYGLAGEKIERDLASAIPFVRVGPFAEAVDIACSMAKKGSVLLSPGCSSYDQFRSFEHRGDAFKALIEKRKNGSKKNNPDSSDH